MSSQFETDELRDLMERAYAAPYGKSCSSLWAEAVQLAHDEGRCEEEFECYVHLASSLGQGGEITRMIAPFLWVDKTRKVHPEYFTPDLAESFAWSYKYLMSAVRAVPTISAQQCLDSLAEMKKLYLDMGDPLKAYYMREYYLYKELGMDEQAEESFSQWQAAEGSELSDCAGCDPSHLVGYHELNGDYESAVKVGERALAGEEETCPSQPESLYTELLIPWLMTGRDDKAWRAHTRSMQRFSYDKHFLSDFAVHINYLVISGLANRPERLKRGLEYFIRFLPWWLEAESPAELLLLSRSFAGLLRHIPQQDVALGVDLPGSLLPWVKAPDIKDPTIADAAQWCTDIAVTLAQEFDERPGIVRPHHVEATREIIFSPPRIDPLPDPVVHDAAGGFTTVDTVDYRVDTGNFSDMERLTVAAEESEEQPLTLISLHGDWKELSDEELDARHEVLQTQLPTIYTMVQAEKHKRGLTWPEQLDTETDPARKLLANAITSFNERDFRSAAIQADEAMRTPTAEPIGVRLTGMSLLGAAAMHAGYASEAIEPLRHWLNLVAAYELSWQREAAATALADALIATKQYSEAAEVISMTLDALSDRPAVKLRAMLVTSLTALDLARAACSAAFDLAKNSEDREVIVDAYQKAFQSAYQEREFDVAISIADEIAQISRVSYRDNPTDDNAAQLDSALVRSIFARTSAPGTLDDAEFAVVESLTEERRDIAKQRNDDERRLAGALADINEDLALGAVRSARSMDFTLHMENALESFAEYRFFPEAARCALTLGEVAAGEQRWVEARARLQEARTFMDQTAVVPSALRSREKGLEEFLNQTLDD
ncbi:hypothetical protein N7326_04755 [Corynebacterium sp. ES2794-CONJ1]|uniref:hypothetical protein n=1 Tax=Corynebacterium sp. ES2794-CONJ1 TaxID=2980553 RepID=UPI0021D8C003|nr:hypothetical protein [Corynebacterium sp. ES2794-CONJ1]MCU9519183.1 hypothetical protein [Corynebacterium sp. ES2794-CONJ1]